MSQSLPPQPTRLLRATRTASWLTRALVLSASVFWANSAFAVGPEDASNNARRALKDIDREAATVQQVIDSAKQALRTPAQRLAEAEVLMRTGDFKRALNLLHEVAELTPTGSAIHTDAIVLKAEAFYQSKQLLSSRRAFLDVVNNPNDQRAAPNVGRAYWRLVDIALRRQDTKDLDDVLAKLNANSAMNSEPLAQYAKGKALLTKRDFTGARSSLGVVPADHPLYAQTRYMLGVVAMREAEVNNPTPKVAPGESPPPAPKAKYAAAIEAFRQVTQLQADTPEREHVIDLAWLAIGRLFYEADQWAEAAEAYSRVERKSPEFVPALYELAWVYLRIGESDRAIRALDVLAVADSENQHAGDAPLVRADLLLRTGQFDKAQKGYEAVRIEFEPLRERVDRFLKSSSNPADYYDHLIKEQLEAIDVAAPLPPLAIQWAREESNGPAAFAVVDEVVRSRDLLKDAQTLVTKLNVVLGSPNRVKAFPELKAGDERAVQLLNRITATRGAIAQGLDEAGEAGGDLARVRAERRELQKKIASLPVTDGDMAARENSAQRQWNSVSQKLQTLSLEVFQLEAVVNGLRRTINENIGGARDPNSIKQWEADLHGFEKELKQYKELINETRKQIEAGRVQVGYGDQRFVDDEAVRKAFKAALTEELRLAAAGGAGGKAAAYANGVSAAMQELEASETRIEGLREGINDQVKKRTDELSNIVSTEAANLINYSQKLEQLDQEARLAVGEVALRNFTLVREKLRNVVVHADVGLTEEAWELREEQMFRVQTLEREKRREEQILDDELREVLDDANDSTTTAPK